MKATLFCQQLVENIYLLYYLQIIRTSLLIFLVVNVMVKAFSERLLHKLVDRGGHPGAIHEHEGHILLDEHIEIAESVDLLALLAEPVGHGQEHQIVLGRLLLNYVLERGDHSVGGRMHLHAIVHAHTLTARRLRLIAYIVQIRSAAYTSVHHD